MLTCSRGADARACRVEARLDAPSPPLRRVNTAANAMVSALARDHRLLAIAEKALSGPVAPFRATLFDKSRQANWLVAWHQDAALPLPSRFDSPGWGPWSEKGGILYAHAPAWALSRILALRVYLDRSTNDNGPLRVVPGSHAAGVLTDEAVCEYVQTQTHRVSSTPRRSARHAAASHPCVLEITEPQSTCSISNTQIQSTSSRA